MNHDLLTPKISRRRRLLIRGNLLAFAVYLAPLVIVYLVRYFEYIPVSYQTILLITFITYCLVAFFSIQIMGQKGALIIEFLYALNLLSGGFFAAIAARLFKSQQEELKVFRNQLLAEKEM